MKFVFFIACFIIVIEAAAIANGQICNINVDYCASEHSCCHTVATTSDGAAASTTNLICVATGTQKGAIVSLNALVALEVELNGDWKADGSGNYMAYNTIACGL